MNAQKYIYGDLVRVVETGQVGVVKVAHPSDGGFIYAVGLQDAASEIIQVDEAALQLVKIANKDETGLDPRRYIT